MLLSLLFSGKLLSGQEYYPAGATATALGNTSVARKDLWAVINNPAGAAASRQPGLGAFFENRFLVPDLGRAAAAIYFPAGTGGFMASLDHMGTGYFSESKLGFGYCLPLGNKVLTGAQLNYLFMHIGDGYGNYQALTFEGGIMVDVAESLTLGIHVFNPLHFPWIGTQEAIPVIMRAGFEYRPLSNLSISAEMNKSTDYTLSIGFGAEYSFTGDFHIRAGTVSRPAMLSFGAGMKLGRLMIDLSSSIHEWLGYSPQCSIRYSLKK